MTMGKRRRVGGYEQDAFSRYWRQTINFKAGRIKAAKRQANKRERREAKKELNA